jgi:hypothetical protein
MAGGGGFELAGFKEAGGFGPPSRLFGCRQRGGERVGAEKAHGNGEEEWSGHGRVVDGGTSHQSDPRANGPGNFFLRGPRRGFS